MRNSPRILSGPLLFILYPNDFEGCLQFSRASIYADDTHVTSASSDIEELIQMTREELENIADWMRVNKLSANPKKNRIYGNRQPPPNK